MDQPAENDLNLQLLRAYIDSANDGIFVVCDEMKFHVANQRLSHWLATPEHVLTDHCHRIPFTTFLPEVLDHNLFLRSLQETLAGTPARFDCKLAPINGAARWVEISMNRVALEIGDLVIGLVRDVGKQREVAAELERRARTDDLTGLANRSEFWGGLKRAVDQPKDVGVKSGLLYVDLDQLKLVNETCGHIAGDALLRDTAETLLSIVPQSALLGRLGGDEFGVLLESNDATDTMRIARRILRAIGTRPFRWNGATFKVSCSIGVVHISPGLSNVPDILGAADAACYVAKDKGRARIQIYTGHGLCHRRRTEMRWVERICSALSEDRFLLYHQRIVPIGADRNLGPFHEILLRLRGQNGSIIRPNIFMPAAERYNLMPAVDRWVVEQVLRSVADDIGFGHTRTGNDLEPLCFVNLSGASLNDRQFPHFLQRKINAHGVPPERLCFEITETVAIQNLKRASHVVHQLKEQGCRFALDDFGSGMSSLSYLKSLPVDYLKIDGSLIRGIAVNSVDKSIVCAIQEIARDMGISTIAEYVENPDIHDVLSRIGVHYGQGYAIHEPCPLPSIATENGAITKEWKAHRTDMSIPVTHPFD
ncbi:MAG: sensor domain-containing protein [Gammaproteobacteria bacterium]